MDQGRGRAVLRNLREKIRSAAETGPRQDAAKKDLDGLLKSLGLRPHRARIGAGQTRTDSLDEVKDAGRFAPPPKWSEQYKAFKEGVGSGK